MNLRNVAIQMNSVCPRVQPILKVRPVKRKGKGVREMQLRDILNGGKLEIQG